MIRLWTKNIKVKLFMLFVHARERLSIIKLWIVVCWKNNLAAEVKWILKCIFASNTNLDIAVSELSLTKRTNVLKKICRFVWEWIFEISHVLAALNVVFISIWILLYFFLFLTVTFANRSTKDNGSWTTNEVNEKTKHEHDTFKKREKYSHDFLSLLMVFELPDHWAEWIIT